MADEKDILEELAEDAAEDVAEDDVPDIPEDLLAIFEACLSEGAESLAKTGGIVPFTALAVGDELFIEDHEAEEPEDSRNMARHVVENARGAVGYAFCYDGYVELDDGVADAIVAEGGIPGDAEGHAIGLLYTADEENGLVFDENPIYLGDADNYMASLAARKEDAEAGEEAE